MMGTATATHIARLGKWRIDWHPGRAQAYTIWRDRHTYYFAYTNEEAREWVRRQGRVSHD